LELGLVLRDERDHGPTSIDPSWDRRTRLATSSDPATIDPDLALLPGIERADARDCRTLVDRHLGRLHALALRLLGNSADADEVCQDAFVRAWRQAAQWTPGQARFSTWLHQVVLNLCRDRLRSQRSTEPLAVLDDVQAPDNPEHRQQAHERAQAIRQALQALPERQREALVLCHYQGLTNIEAAAVLELSVDALESLLARARRSLRGSLATSVYRQEGDAR
jgi:RNA polymerase sigma-70 factor (ECF subfamily)